MATAARSPGEEIAKRRSRHRYALDLRVACSLYFGAVNQINNQKLSAGVYTLAKMMATALLGFAVSGAPCHR
jgi:hypothetical protein